MKPEAKSLLAEPRMTETSVVLDLFFVRLPFGDPRINDRLWPDVDEQALSPQLREQLARHGFRAGVCTTHPPVDLEKLLIEHARGARRDETSGTDLLVEPLVRRRHLQLPKGRPAEIMASGLYDSLPILEVSPDGQVSGSTFRKAQGMFTIHAYPEPDGRVRLRLRPEVQHGELRQQFLQRDAHLVLESRRPRKAFEDMTMEVRLAVGEMFLITTLPDRPGSPAHYFFSESASDGFLQKLLIVRLSQTQHDSALGSEIPPAEQPGE